MTIIDATPHPLKATFTRAALLRGLMAALPFILSNGMAGVVMGLAYRALGLGFVPAVLFSFVVYSATAQAVTLAMWTMPPPLSAMLIACVATNARYLVMGAHLSQLFAGIRRRVILPILFLLADASWLMATAEAERREPDAGFLLGASIPMAIGWVGGTALGHALPLSPSGPFAAAAALLPAAFVVTLLPTQWRGKRSVLPWVTSALIAALVARLLSPSWAMLAGGGVGTLVSMTRGDDA